MARKNNSQQTISTIIEVAARLFTEKGYDQTSMQDIVDGLGMSKGAIFHHFKSKEEISEAVITQYSERFLAAAKQVADEKHVPIIKRFIKTVMALSAGDDAGKRIREHIHTPQNALMHQKMERVLISGAVPILAGIIHEGVRQGIFNTPYPEESVEMLIYYINSAFTAERISQLSEKEISQRIKGFILTVERLLGARNGSLRGLTALFNGMADENNKQ